MILIPLFTAVGTYLLVYGRRRQRMMSEFAQNHGFEIDSTLERDLELLLNDSFQLRERKLARRFGQLASIVDGGDVLMFRSVEALDLSQYGVPMVTHHPRVCASFQVEQNLDEFFLLLPDGQVQSRIAARGPVSSKAVEAVAGVAASCGASHAISVSLAAGQGLIYFEPKVVGGEKLVDVETLYCMATALTMSLGTRRGA